MEALNSNITETCPLPFSGITGGLFLNAVTAIIATHCTILDDYNWPPDYSQNVLEDDHGKQYIAYYNYYELFTCLIFLYLKCKCFSII